ncbi:hypothetical protein [Mesonia aestuariivivens]|uniref:STAS/SEC14 domain-containing protein n=1 Tax=Mesonia aestuariivivens TaxID=2796128 RepID=A0ABS6VYQ5_9FLAO|nr:hypothetical protein [Mesonia aestuariivivens]MBW2960634.1 hypothetical protein [Mesonia aestuariivivens]
MKPFKIIDDDIAYIEFYEDYVISSVKEDVIFDLDELNWLFMLLEEHYPNQSFGYISNRKYNYNLNPTNYEMINLYEKIVCHAVVYHSEIGKKIAVFEKNFSTNAFEIFDSLEKAKEWVIEFKK